MRKIINEEVLGNFVTGLTGSGKPYVLDMRFGRDVPHGVPFPSPLYVEGRWIAGVCVLDDDGFGSQFAYTSQRQASRFYPCNPLYHKFFRSNYFQLVEDGEMMPKMHHKTKAAVKRVPVLVDCTEMTGAVLSNGISHKLLEKLQCSDAVSESKRAAKLAFRSSVACAASKLWPPPCRCC